MSEIKAKAQSAERLLRNEDFQAIVAEIQSDAVALFKNAACDNITLERAHFSIRATQHIIDALQSRIAAAKMEQRKQDRASD